MANGVIDITMDEAALADAKGYLEEMKKHMDNSYELLKSLLAEIEAAGEWKGESHNAFMAYMDLMKQYHRSFTDENGENPVSAVITAFGNLLERNAGFYDDFPEYRILEEIE